MSSPSSKPVVEFSMATYLLEMEKRLQSAQKDLKNDLQSAQAISEERMLDSQKQQIYKIVFLGTSVGCTAFAIFEIGMKVFGYGITKLG
jgi:hypothetical protein